MDAILETDENITFDDEEIVVETSSFLNNRNEYRKRELRCTLSQCKKDFDSSTDINTNGHRSLKLNMWFCSTFCCQLYQFENKIGGYSNPDIRKNYINIFKKYTNVN